MTFYLHDSESTVSQRAFLSRFYIQVKEKNESVYLSKPQQLMIFTNSSKEKKIHLVKI